MADGGSPAVRLCPLSSVRVSVLPLEVAHSTGLGRAGLLLCTCPPPANTYGGRCICVLSKHVLSSYCWLDRIPGHPMPGEKAWRGEGAGTPDKHEVAWRTPGAAAVAAQARALGRR